MKSKNHHFIYVGMTGNLEDRLRRHNAGYERSTKHYAPFDLIFTEEQETRPLARKREKYWKSGIGKEKLRQMIANGSAGLSTDR